jgi:cell division protein ZapA
MTNQIVSVEIAGQRYPIRSSLDVAYVTELASYVDEKMKAAADAAPTSDMLGLALLVALNIADECFRARQQSSSASGELNERALRLERLVDDALGSFEIAQGSSLEH